MNNFLPSEKGAYVFYALFQDAGKPLEKNAFRF